MTFCVRPLDVARDTKSTEIFGVLHPEPRQPLISRNITTIGSIPSCTVRGVGIQRAVVGSQTYREGKIGTVGGVRSVNAEAD